MNPQYMQNVHGRYNHLLKLAWLNPSLQVVGIILITLGVMIIAATSMILLQGNHRDNTRQINGKNVPANLVVENVENQKIEDPVEGVMSQSLGNNDRAKQEESNGNNKIGVSINGTPISIPHNGSVNKHIRSQSGDGDVSVSITSKTSTSSTGDNTASSTSLSIESTSTTESEGD